MPRITEATLLGLGERSRRLGGGRHVVLTALNQATAAVSPTLYRAHRRSLHDGGERRQSREKTPEDGQKRTRTSRAEQSRRQDTEPGRRRRHQASRQPTRGDEARARRRQAEETQGRIRLGVVPNQLVSRPRISDAHNLGRPPVNGSITSANLAPYPFATGTPAPMTGAFPFHTDGAFLRLPPRYGVMRVRGD